MAAIIGTLICLSPLLCLAVGYYIGRYGSPIVIKRQRRQDRRAVPEIENEEIEVYRT